MKWFIIIIILIYGLYQPKQLSPAQTEYKIPDKRVVLLEAFFAKTNSPLQKYAEDFIKASDKYNLDFRLLPSVACIESSCGKYYQHNPFGFGSDTLDFGDVTADIFGVANAISSLSYYQAYNQDKSLASFSRAYNPKYSESYLPKLRYFYEQLVY